MDVALLFDTEDVFSPPGVGNDDSILELAQIMTAADLPATFLFIGDRALTLKERGRNDVIAAVKAHDVGLHTRSALHPCSPEYVAGKTWPEGVDEAVGHEKAGVEILGEVFGQDAVALSTHWFFATPHSLRAAALLDLPYIYAYPAAPPLYSISRYAAALCLPWWSPTLADDTFLPYYGGFDDQYHDDQMFTKCLEGFTDHVAKCVDAGHPFLSLILYHPPNVRLREPIDQFMTPNGVNLRPQQFGVVGRPASYSAREVQKNLNNFRRLAETISTHPHLNPVRIPQVVRQYGWEPEVILWTELLAYARDVSRASEILLSARFSPAELIVAMAEAFLAIGQGATPARLPRRPVIGPQRNPIMNLERLELERGELSSMATELMTFVTETGHLLHGFGLEFPRVGINQFYAALAEALVRFAESGSIPDRIALRVMPRYPALAVPIGQRFMEVAEGDNIDPDLHVDALYRHAKLQTWSLKPSWTAVPDQSDPRTTATSSTRSV